MTEVTAQDDKLLLNKTTPPFQLLPMPKVDEFMRRRLYSKRKGKLFFFFNTVSSSSQVGCSLSKTHLS